MPQIKTAQDLFGGLFTEASPEGLPQGASPRAINVDYVVGAVGPRPGKRSAFTFPEDIFESPAGFTQSVGDGEPWSGGSVTLNNATACPLITFFPGGPSSGVISGNSLTVTIPVINHDIKINDVIFFYTRTGNLFHADTTCLSVTDNLGTVYGQLGAQLVIPPRDFLQVFFGTITTPVPLGGTFSYTLNYNHLVAEVEEVTLGTVVRGITSTPSQFAESVFFEPGPPPTPYGGPPITTTDTEFVMSFLLSPRLAQIDPDYTRISTTPGISGSYIAAHYVNPSIIEFHSPPGTYTGNFHGTAGSGTLQVAVKNVSFPIRPCGCPTPHETSLGHLTGFTSGNTLPTTITVAGSLAPVHAGDTMFLALYTNPSGTPITDRIIVSILDQTYGAIWSQVGATQTFQAGGNPSAANTTNFQLFTAIAPVDFFGNVNLLITYNGTAQNHATYGTFVYANLGALQQVAGDTETSANPTGPPVTGSASKNFIISFQTSAEISTGPALSPFFTLGSQYVGAAVYHDPVSGAYAGAAGTYTPQWNPGGSVVAAVINAVYATQSGCGCEDPTVISMFFGSSTVDAPDTITYTGGPGADNTGFPCMILYPFASNAVSGGGVVGSDGWIETISDDQGGIWSELTAPTSCTDSFGSVDPAELFNYQYWVGVFSNGLPASFNLTIKLHRPLAQMSSFTTPNFSTSMFRHVTGVNQYAFHKISPTTTPLNSGAAITTTIPTTIVTTANIFNVGKIIPTGTGILYTGSGANTVSAAVYNGPLIKPAGSYDPAWSYGGASVPSPFQDTVLSTIAMTPQDCGGGTSPTSQTLQALNFNLDIPLAVSQGQIASGCGSTYTIVDAPTGLPILGVEVQLTGSQSAQPAGAELQVQLQLPDGTLSPDIKTAVMPLTTGTVIVGSPTDLWGFTADEITAALLDDPNFQVNIVAVAPGGETVTFTVTVEVLIAFSVPDPPPSVNYLKSFSETGGELTSLVLGSNGTMYKEDAINAPNLLSPLFTEIFPDSSAQSATLDNREYIAVSDLINGTDIPRVYSPPNFDRLSQVGPGAPPSASGSNIGGTIPITSITQPTIKSDPENPGHISGFLWSAGPGNTQAGNVLTVYWGRSNPPGPSTTNDPDLKIGVGVTITGADTANPNNQFNGQLIDGNYTVTSVGEGVPPGATFGRWYFTVQVAVTQFVNQADHIEANAPDGNYQVTTATLTSSAPIPNMQIGSTMEISGTGGSPPAGYDGSWLVTDSGNASQLQITNTSLTSNVATYSYTLISGVAPVVGSIVTVGLTLNGDGIFNVSNATITSTSPGIFSISLVHADVSSQPEAGTGIVSGTVFRFEPGQPVGNIAGVGTVVVAGIFTFGVRKLCYSFLTRNGFLTQPSPIATVDIVISSTGIAVSNLSPGPDNVVARVIHFTGAGGGQFYNIPDPVFVTDPITGQKITNDSTWVMDNTTTNVVLSFSDTVLLAADEIDIQGNNLFACYELGSCTALVPYSGAQRLAAIGEQNKVFNFRNHSFDGGIGGSTQTFPLGWTVDPTNGAGGSVVTSPIFGNAYQIRNVTGGPQAAYGMISQPAYKDEFLVDIINASTTYSVRVTAAVAAPVASGNLIIDLFSPLLMTALGTFSLPLSSLTTRMKLFSGTLLTTMLAPVPQDLVLRIWAQNIPDTATVILDREEVFPTEAPNLHTQVIFSYAQNFEAFDRITGVIKPAQNSQPIKSCFVEFDTFYMGKINSLFSTADNGTTEPVVADAGWGVRTVSQSVGTTSVYGVTTAIDQPNSGEDWAVLAGQPGLYIYDGGEPVKLSEEIQSIWDTINWDFEHTIWTLNDIINRRILVGVPLKTYWLDAYGRVSRGTWLPAGVIPDDPAPTTPNVVLELNYKQLNTANALSSSVGVHRSVGGKILDSEITRKWALWTIKAPAAAFLTRSNNTAPIFVGNSNGNGKIYQLIEGLLEDDGSPFSERYITSPFLPRSDAQQQQVGVLRCGYDTMTLIIDGMGSFGIVAHNNYVDGAGTRALLPDLTFPVATYGDAEVPLDEEANRLFIEFIAQCVGSAYTLSGMTMLMSTSGFAPYSGRNR